MSKRGLIHERGVVTAKERNDWVNQGTTLRRRAEATGAAVEKAREKVSTLLEAKDHELDLILSSDDEDASINETIEGKRDDCVTSKKLEIEKEVVERVMKARAAVSELKSTNEMTVVEELAKRVLGEIDSIRGQQTSRYATLAKEEDSIFRHLNEVEKRLEEDSMNGRSRTHKYSSSKRECSTLGSEKNIHEDQIPEAVTAYEKFMEETGPTGGWDDRDHEIFLKELKRHHGDYSLCITGALRVLPHFTRKEVIKHARWDSERSDLLLKKRVAIKKWRLHHDFTQNRYMNEMHVTETPTSRLARMQTEVRMANEKRFRHQQKRDLENWWREKAIEVENMKEIRNKKEAESDRKRQAVRAAQQAKKEAVLLYRRQKLQEIEDRKKLEEQERINSIISREERKQNALRIQMLQEKDMNFMQQKLSAIQSRKDAKAEREARQKVLASKVKFTAEKDTSRLFRKTQTLIHRAKPETEAEKQAKVLNSVPRVQLIQHKIIPSWRQGL